MKASDEVETVVDVFPEPNIWESALQRMMEMCLRRGAIAFDVGANIGALSAFMWRQVGPLGRVDSFEANPLMAERLRRNFETNGIKDPHIVERAAWSRSGVPLTFEIEPGFYSSGSRVVSAGAPEGTCANHVAVTSVALDDYCDELGLDPDLIKIDVEGAERHVLEGALRLLKRKKPSVLIEYSPTRNPDSAPALLHTLGYRMLDCHDYSRWHGTRTTGPLTDLIAIHPENDHHGDQWQTDPQIIEIERFKLFPKKNEDGRTELQSEMVQVPAGWWLFAVDFDYSGFGAGSIALFDEQRRTHYLANTGVPFLSEYVSSHAILRTDAPGRFQLSVSPRCEELRFKRGSMVMKQVRFES